jgi:hypothetical protein
MAVVLALLIGFTALAYVRAQVDSPGTLSAYPDDCDFVLTVNWTEARRALAEVRWAIKELSGMEIDEWLVLDWLQSVFSGPSDLADETTTIDLRADVLPWIGRDVSVGLDYDNEALMGFFETGTELMPPGPAPQTLLFQTYDDVINYVMCAVSCRDAGKAKPFLDKLESILREADLDPVTVAIAEHEWTCVAFGPLMGLFGIIEDRLIAFFAPEPRVIPNLERVVGILKSGEGSIASSSDYRLLTEEVGEGGLLSLITTIDLSVSSVELAGSADDLDVDGQPEGEGTGSVEASEPSETSELPETSELSEARRLSDGSQLPDEVPSSGLLKVFIDRRGLRIRAASTLADHQVLTGPGTLGFAPEPLMLNDRSTMVPEYVVGFMQIGSIYEYWSIAKAVLESLPAPTGDAPGSSVVPTEMLAFIDTIMSHFVGDTHVALTGDSARPMMVVTSQVTSGDMLVSYLEMLVTQSTPGLQIHFSDHGGELVKVLWVPQEGGYLPLISYSLVDDLLIVSNLEPAVRLTMDTIRGTVPSVEQKPVIMRLREEMGDGGLYLLYMDVGTLVEFLQPLGIQRRSDEYAAIQMIDRVFEHMSGHMKIKDHLLSAEFEISLKAQPERDAAAVVDTVEETAED